MDQERKHSLFSVFLHSAAAIVMGYISIIIVIGTLIKIALAIIVLIVIGFITQKIIGKKNKGWWIGNGAAIYLFLWFLTWVILFNIL